MPVSQINFFSLDENWNYYYLKATVSGRSLRTQPCLRNSYLRTKDKIMLMHIYSGRNKY